ncbi:MAG: thioredoxin-disulfide reductase [Clostridia bacterium]|nr:thioredoxin-disulfide reductase [Clostridia bacterium]
MIDIAIIGGGPAGLAAGLYAARSGLKCVLFEELFTGGKLTKAHMIENYPGFPEGISGTELAMKMEEQALRFGLEIRYEPVERLELTGQEKHIVTCRLIESARTVIFAAGTAPKTLDVPGEEEFLGAGISYCATCDGAFFKGRDVAVIGGGNSAVGNAIYLARTVNKVTLIHNQEQLNVTEQLKQRIAKEANIEVVLNREVTAFVGEGMLSHVALKNTVTGEASELAVQGAFVALGNGPCTRLVHDQLKLTPDGYIHTDHLMRTSLSGVYAVGDVRNTPLRQVVTAVADGAVAASQAIEYLSR